MKTQLVKKGQYLQLNTPEIGKDVVFAPSVHEDAETLVTLANKGYYYPLMAIKHLAALSTGLTGKNNVFIPNINDFKTNSLQKVVVFVPGIAATVERRPNDVLTITHIVLSDGYESIEKGSNQKPGVYSVSKETGSVDVRYRKNGRITSEDNRNVVIADPSYKSPKEAGEAAVKRLEALFGEDAASKCNFDLFYSPLGSKLNGMRNYNPTEVNKTYGYAGLLANAIEQSKNKKGIVWASERSGSLVLTQALLALAEKNISFEGQHHIVKMRWAKSNPNLTYQAVTQLGMVADKNLLRSNSSIRAALSATLGNAERARDNSDPYSWKDYRKELADGTMAANAVISMGALLGGLALAFTPVGTVLVGSVASAKIAAVLTATGTTTGLIGTTQYAYKKGKQVKDRL